MRRFSLLLMALLLMTLLPLTALAAAPRGYAAGKYALELDGVVVGWIESAEGGNPVAEVVTEKLGGDWLVRKHIGQVKYEDITLSVRANMSPTFYQWIEAWTSGKAQRKSGAIIAADYNFKEVSRFEFTNAQLTELGLPALDAASKDAAKMTVKFAPEITRWRAGSGKTVQVPEVRQKQWLPANFRLKIDGLDEPLQRVNKIEAITIKQRVGGAAEFSDLAVTVDDAITNPLYEGGMNRPNALYDWADDFVVAGNNDNKQEKSGTLEYLTADGKALFTLSFQGLGIYKLTPDKMEAGAEGVRRVKAEMYCESMRFTYDAAK